VRICENLERRLVLSSAVTVPTLAVSAAVSDPNENLLDAQNGPLANAGQALINLYVGYRRAQTAAKDDDIVAAFDVSPDPLAASSEATAAQSLEISGQNVGVEIRPTDPSDSTFAADLTAAGVTVQHQTDGVVEGTVPITLLRDIADRSDVFSITPIYRPIIAAETVDQANTIENVAAARSMFNVNGTGVTVGVISDSYNNLGTASASISSGNLPSSVDVIQDEQDGNGTDEGRAMLEEIYDLAPGASLAFDSADNGGQQNYAAAISALQNAGASVIVDDATSIDEPYFQPGVIDTAIANFTADGGAYFSAAGNSGLGGLEQNATFVASGSDELINFTPQSGTTTRLGINVSANDALNGGYIGLEWDQPFNGVSGSDTSEIYLKVYDTQGNLVMQSDDNNLATGIPGQFDITGLTAGNYQVEIGAYGANASLPLPDMYKLVGPFSITTAGVPGAGESAIFGHPGNGDSIAVGAISADAAAVTPLESDSYSSIGPNTLIFDQNGNKLATPQTIQEPQVTGVDGVTTSFFGVQSDLGPFTFYGTSAAAPNVAAIAALLKQQSHSLTQTQILADLETGAQPLNGAAAGTWDPQAGFGLVNALDALGASSTTPTPPTSSLTAIIQQVEPNPHTGGVASIDITFSAPVTGFTISSLTLQYGNFGGNLLSARDTLTGSGEDYVLTGLTNVTGFMGTYTLLLTATGSGITGSGGTALTTNASMTWQVAARGTTTTNTPGVAEDVTATAMTKHSVLLSWTNTATSTYVVILRSLDKHFKTGVVRIQLVSGATDNPEVDSATYADGGLRAGTRYYYRIYEGNDHGLSVFTTAVSVLGSGLEVNYVSTLMSEAQEQALRATL
jgi:hypothetical protein